MKFKTKFLLSFTGALPLFMVPVVVSSRSFSKKDNANKNNKTLEGYTPSPNFNAIPLAQIKAGSTIRIGSWNLLNFSGSNKKSTLQYNKSRAFTSVIKNQKMDVIGLTEINKNQSESALNSLLTNLNELDQDSKWKGIASPVLHGAGLGQEKQAEHIIFLYRSSIMTLVDWDQGKVYQNNFWQGHFKSKTQFNFSRPPFAAKFKTIGPIVNDFTVISIHADAPGVSKSRGEAKGFGGNGAQEIEEAYHSYEAVAWFDSQNGEDNEMIFLGDTNIKADDANVYKPFFDNNFNSLFSQDKRNATTLSRTIGKYANSYDKIFYKGDLKHSNATIWDLWSIKTNHFFDFDQFSKDRDKERAAGPYKNQLDYYKNIVSDHTLVYFDLTLDKKDLT